MKVQPMQPGRASGASCAPTPARPEAKTQPVQDKVTVSSPPSPPAEAIAAGKRIAQGEHAARLQRLAAAVRTGQYAADPAQIAARMLETGG
ncbi:MAG TPA: hypothetical protein VND93_27620 [Myxococcales bacterium]|jgi:hypothetical protein|nr:hypothetical protein [Myxococcales bacterium]